MTKINGMLIDFNKVPTNYKLVTISKIKSHLSFIGIYKRGMIIKG